MGQKSGSRKLPSSKLIPTDDELVNALRRESDKWRWRETFYSFITKELLAEGQDVARDTVAGWVTKAVSPNRFVRRDVERVLERAKTLSQKQKQQFLWK